MDIKCKTSKEIGGMGHSIKRKEDDRFIQGKGRYIDDIKLPGSHSRSSSLTSSRCAAIFLALSFNFLEAMAAAAPAVGVLLLA